MWSEIFEFDVTVEITRMTPLQEESFCRGMLGVLLAPNGLLPPQARVEETGAEADPCMDSVIEAKEHVVIPLCLSEEFEHEHLAVKGGRVVD